MLDYKVYPGTSTLPPHTPQGAEGETVQRTRQWWTIISGQPRCGHVPAYHLSKDKSYFPFFSLIPTESEGNSWFDVTWKCAHTAKWKSKIKRRSTWRSTRLWSTKFCQCTFKQFLLPIRLFLLFKTSSDRWIAQPNFKIGDILRFRKNYYRHVKLLVWPFSA